MFNAGWGVSSAILVDVLCLIILWRPTMASTVYYVTFKHQKCMYFYGTYVFKMRKATSVPGDPERFFLVIGAFLLQRAAIVEGDVRSGSGI